VLASIFELVQQMDVKTAVLNGDLQRRGLHATT